MQLDNPNKEIKINKRDIIRFIRFTFCKFFVNNNYIIIVRFFQCFLSLVEYNFNEYHSFNEYP